LQGRERRGIARSAGSPSTVAPPGKAMARPGNVRSRRARQDDDITEEEPMSMSR
jgi:hypothetical protein